MLAAESFTATFYNRQDLVPKPAEAWLCVDSGTWYNACNSEARTGVFAHDQETANTGRAVMNTRISLTGTVLAIALPGLARALHEFGR